MISLRIPLTFTSLLNGFVVGASAFACAGLIAAYVVLPIMQARERKADHAAVDRVCPPSAGYGLMKYAPRDGRTIEICHANSYGYSYTDLFTWDATGDWRGPLMEEAGGGVRVKWRGAWMVAPSSASTHGSIGYLEQRDGPYRWRRPL